MDNQKPMDIALKDFQNYKRIRERLNDDMKKHQRYINKLKIEKYSLTNELAAIIEKSKQIQLRYKDLHFKISVNKINAKKKELARIKVKDKTQKFQNFLKKKSEIVSTSSALSKPVQLATLEQQKKILLQQIVENKSKLDKIMMNKSLNKI